MQVYSIITLQLVLTTVVAAIVVANASVQHFLLQNVGVQIALMLVSMLALIPLYIWRNSHPHNLVLLGVWTCLFSGGWYCQPQVNKAVGLFAQHNNHFLLAAAAVTVGMACSFFEPVIVFEARPHAACAPTTKPKRCMPHVIHALLSWY